MIRESQKKLGHGLPRFARTERQFPRRWWKAKFFEVKERQATAVGCDLVRTLFWFANRPKILKRSVAESKQTLEQNSPCCPIVSGHQKRSRLASQIVITRIGQPTAVDLAEARDKEGPGSTRCSFANCLPGAVVRRNVILCLGLGRNRLSWKCCKHGTLL
jgi:hypothetical protein